MNPTQTYSPEEVAELCAVPLETIRNWRRLPEDHLRYLESTKIDGRHRYSLTAIVEWMRRPENELYREAVLGSFAPLDARLALSPQPPGAGLIGGISNYSHPHTEHEGADHD